MALIHKKIIDCDEEHLTIYMCSNYVSKDFRKILEFSAYKYLTSSGNYCWMSTSNYTSKADYDDWTPWPEYLNVDKYVFEDSDVYEFITSKTDKELIDLTTCFKLGGLSLRNFALKVIGNNKMVT